MNQLTINKERRFSMYELENIEYSFFNLSEYSALKFGSDIAAKNLGYRMASKFYRHHFDVLTRNKCVVIPSAFNVVKIASTILASHFMNKLNDILTRKGYDIVEWTTMHRSMSYIADYCTMSKDQRKELLENDKLYINRDFIKGKTLLFVDDVTITGTHEEKIVNFLKDKNITNKRVFCYCVQYHGNNPEIEHQLNHSGIKTIDDYIKLVNEPNHHIVVRAIRFLLDLPPEKLVSVLQKLDNKFIDKLYIACLSKEYHKIYCHNFEIIRNYIDEIKECI